MIEDQDRELRAAILDAVTRPRELIQRIHAYYADADRADRTARETMYLHLGLVTGALHNALDDAERSHAR